MPRVWLLLQVGSEVKRSSHAGYKDIEGVRYVWDSTVPNSRNVFPGDIAILWNKKTWLGAAVIKSIDFDRGTREMFSCPRCGTTQIQPRKRKFPTHRCNVCQFEFDVPKLFIKDVNVYAGNFDGTWHYLNGEPTSKDIRELSNKFLSQHSMRDCDWARAASLLEKYGNLAVTESLEMGAAD
jgi:transcription elongation factor Elf1